MSITVISSNQLPAVCQKSPEKCQISEVNDNQIVVVVKNSDTVEKTGLKKGLLPTGKGLLAGTLTGAATGAGLGAVLSNNMIGFWGDLTTKGATQLGGIVGGIGGAVSGMITANFTDSKLVAAAVGGVVGGTANIVLAGPSGWLVGAVSGASGAVAGSMVAERK